MASTRHNEADVLKALAELVEYNKETGVFTWLPRQGGTRGLKAFNTRLAGKVCGILRTDGYIRIGFSYSGKYLHVSAHRLAYFIFHGFPPKYTIDHIDRDKTNNRINNLRDVEQAVNAKNRDVLINNTSGATGVYMDRRTKRFRAYITVNGKYKYVGMFKTIDDATIALNEQRKLHGFLSLQDLIVENNTNHEELAA